MESVSMTELAEVLLAEARARLGPSQWSHGLRRPEPPAAAHRPRRGSWRRARRHESPGEATLPVLVGRVSLTAGHERWEGGPGDYLVIPSVRHRLDAMADSAILLTVVVVAHRQDS